MIDGQVEAGVGVDYRRLTNTAAETRGAPCGPALRLEALRREPKNAGCGLPKGGGTFPFLFNLNYLPGVLFNPTRKPYFYETVHGEVGTGFPITGTTLPCV